MESYLLGQGLWNVVCGDERQEVATTTTGADAMIAWTKTNVKVEFVLKRAITSELFDHIIECWSAAEIWTSFDGLFN
ncbi:hypothetical protein KSP40_PGU000730 [Platanthera guangdongensis]|uniref:Uncharacterized protein n=1 Tax=Platanthera guangdongensis TaxID=2320717 RepID=A0ABR2MFY6_9ASPA